MAATALSISVKKVQVHISVGMKTDHLDQVMTASAGFCLRVSGNALTVQSCTWSLQTGQWLKLLHK